MAKAFTGGPEESCGIEFGPAIIQMANVIFSAGCGTGDEPQGLAEERRPHGRGAEIEGEEEWFYAARRHAGK